MERAIRGAHRRVAGILLAWSAHCTVAVVLALFMLSPVWGEWCTFADRGIRLDLPNVPIEHSYSAIDNGGAIVIRIVSGTFVNKPQLPDDQVAAAIWMRIAPPMPGAVMRVAVPKNGGFSAHEFIWDSPATSFVVRCRIWIHKKEFRLVLIKAPQDLSPDYWHKIVDSVKLAGGKVVMNMSDE